MLTKRDSQPSSVEVSTDFPSPFEVSPPEGAEGWERLYPYYMQFSEDRRDTEEGKFWFHDSMHYPSPQYPFDTIMWEHTWVILNQNTTRFFRVPSALGIEHRIVNGYVYLSPNIVTDPDEVQRRLEHFTTRAGHYFTNWDEIYGGWVEKATDCRNRLMALEFTPLAELEPETAVFAAQPLGSGYRLYESYSRLLENVQEMAYLHFDMLGLGYGAYLTFRDFCHSAFPGIRDQTVARMVAGIDILMFRPDDELRKLARLGVELGLAAQLTAGGTPAETIDAIRGADRGQEWLAALDQAKDPWFWFSTGAGLEHTYPAWIDDMTIPFSVMGSYVEKVLAGETIERPLAEVQAEAERLAAEYRELLTTSEDRQAFDDLVALARTVYPFVENHNFYCEHQHYTMFWNKVRDLGGVFAHHGYFDQADDVFMLHRFEMFEALWDLETGWACEMSDRRDHWQREIAERKRIMDALGRWPAPPALGPKPDAVTEPFTVMLWGITTEVLDRWQRAGDDDSAELHGVAASPGVVEGPARVILSPTQLNEVQAGEILVCPITAPSWAPVFTKIKAAVSDIGGIMAHAAIVSREYGLPAVVGTGFGTKRIQTGQMVRVDGDTGVVTILSE
jgi:pyruvate, water dikinase